MERKIDKIKRLEKELGRYRKKSGDQARQIASLNEQLSGADAAVQDLSRMVDAILIQTALTYGQEALDEESGEKLGVRLTLPEYRVEELLARYEVRARPDRQAGTYVVGVVPREGKDGQTREKAGIRAPDAADHLPLHVVEFEKGVRESFMGVKG